MGSDRLSGDARVRRRGSARESLAIRQELDDKAHTSALYNNLGLVAHWEGNLDGAREFYEQSLEIHHELGDKWALAISLNNLGYLAIEQKDYEWARMQLRASLNLQREVGEPAPGGVSEGPGDAEEDPASGGAADGEERKHDEKA